MSVLFTFPGQGAQKPGMLHALPRHADTARTLSEASAVLGRDILGFDSEAALRSTIAVQLCLLVAGVAMARVLTAHRAGPDMVAGLSIGAWPAAVIAGVLSFDDAVRLVELRGRLMENAYPSGYGMTAINGLTLQQLEPLVERQQCRRQQVYLANLNGLRQIVIAGSDSAMRAVAERALALGAQHAERLQVAVPSHCALLSDQASALASSMTQIPLARPHVAFISSSEARALFDGRRIGADLAANMAHPVLWADTVRHAWERGARLAVEMPSGSVLTKLTLPEFPDGVALSCEAAPLDSLVLAITEGR
jgi:malonate decarboxylase epsilon subunit